ncbi:hypothetical protein GQ53DRAFT_746947 [Thozetella sp. PMI_491]|nr:hypothetical protein GQ53DRAFT_746947 [Thozetella sp. PMI_491]
MDRKKIVHRLETPYSSVQWPQTTQEDQDSILELLCNLLTPLGVYRKSHITPSRGKRSKLKRKRSGHAETEKDLQQPPRPAVAAYVDVGLASISRHLEALSSQENSRDTEWDGALPAHELRNTLQPYSVIFVARSGMSPIFHSHFLQMMVAASKAKMLEEPMRLVAFSRPCEERLSAAVGIPRVTSLALRSDAPQSKALVDFVRAHVPAPEILWLEEARTAKHLVTKIESTSTSIGQPKKAPLKT